MRTILNEPHADTAALMEQQDLATLLEIHAAPWAVYIATQAPYAAVIRDGNGLTVVGLAVNRSSAYLLQGIVAAVNMCAART